MAAAARNRVAPVGEGKDEDVGAQERTKGQPGCAFIGRGGERGLRPEAMAINSHGGFKAFKRGALIREKQKGD
jgi:hypothetical protein